MSGRSILGIVLILLGGGLVLDQTGVWDFSDILSTWWPLILVLIAVVQLATRSAPLIAGLIILAVGAIFQARNLQLLPQDIWSLVWPAVLILAGVWLVLARGRASRVGLSAEDRIRSFVAFGGANPRNESSNFSGGSVTAVFGGTEVDLRGAKLAEAGARLEVTAAFGGVEIIVPESWKVRVSGLPIFGGWENKTRHSQEPEAAGPAMEISCLAMFGGVEVHN